LSTRPSTLAEIFPNPPTDLDRDALDLAKVPAHIALIMDGNGRWAEARGLERGEGHKAGVRAVREAITTCNDVGVRYLTIYSFSTENWKRPKTEVTGLMDLFAQVMGDEIDGLDEEHVRIELLGHVEDLPLATRTVFKQAAKRTAKNTGMTLAIAVNYGSRLEIVDAARSLARDAKAGALDPDSIDEELFSSRLYTADMPDPDLLIRTSGELRLSNFLLWQLAYAEFYVTDVLFPDFDRYDILRALLAYQQRDRRFGKVK
jgi:undecaprenyl diphosphate synthase